MHPRTPQDVDAELREELDAHVALGADALVARGMSREDAEAEMRARLGADAGGVGAVARSAQRRSRTQGRRELMRTVFRDVVFGMRQLRRTPSFTLGVILSLGFGIGASGTVYTWMQGMVLRPLPAVHEPERLITVRPELRNGFGISLDEYREWRDQSHTVSGLAAVSLAIFSVKTRVDAAANAEPIYGMFVSANYFDVLGVAPATGRGFIARDDRPGAHPVVILSDAAWRQRFGGEDVVGRTIQLDGQLAEIVGVMPRNFGGNLAVARFDLWVTLSTRPYFHPAERDTWQRRDNRWMDAFGRLAPEATLAQANAEFHVIAERQAATFAEDRGRAALAVPLDTGSANQVTELFKMLLAIVALVVLLICSNVANLLLARAASRHRELAVRLSLGAGRTRIVAQLMTESAFLAIIGAGVGIVIAIFARAPLAYLMPPSSLPMEVPMVLDLRFLGVVIGVTCGCVLAFGLAPALMGSKIDVVESLRNGARGSSASRTRLRTGLVVAQFAFALSVLVFATLVLERDRDVRSMDFGFRDPEHVLLVQTEISLAGYQSEEDWSRTIELAADRVRALPGVRSVALGTFVPLGIMGYIRRPISVPGRPEEPGSPDRVLSNAITQDYFALMGIPVLEGRGILDTDTPDHRAVVVVNQAFAQRYFAGQAWLGRTFTFAGREVTIVGVSANGRYDYRDIDDATVPMVYQAWRQVPGSFVSLHVRTDGDPLALSDGVRTAVREVDAHLPLLTPTTLATYTSVPFYGAHSTFQVLVILSGVALLLASMGLFSVVSYGVTLRTQEIGIRMALGATQHAVTRMFLGSATRMLVYGTLTGVAVAMVVAAIARSRIPQIPPASIAEFVVPVLTLAACALAAGVVPARRAAAVDPALTLRSD